MVSTKEGRTPISGTRDVSEKANSPSSTGRTPTDGVTYYVDNDTRENNDYASQQESTRLDWPTFRQYVADGVAAGYREAVQFCLQRKNLLALLSIPLLAGILALLGVYAFEPVTWEGWFTAAVIVLVLLFLVVGWMSTHITFLLALLVLVTAGVITIAQGLAGFSNKGMATVAILFIVSAGVEQTSAVNGLLRRLLGQPTRIEFTILRLTFSVAFASAFLNNTPIVAMMIPLLQQWSRRVGIPQSKLLMPMNIATILGGTCTLMGTSTNLVVSGLAEAQGLKGPDGSPIQFGLFGITRVGAIYAVIGILYMTFATRWLLPDLDPDHVSDKNKASGKGDGAVREYQLHLRLTPSATAVGAAVAQSGLLRFAGCQLSSVVRCGRVYGLHPLLSSDSGSAAAEGGFGMSTINSEYAEGGLDLVLEPKDVLVFTGSAIAIARLLRDSSGLVLVGLEMASHRIAPHKQAIYEVVLSDASPLVDRTVREGGLDRFNASVIAVHRHSSVGAASASEGDNLNLLQYTPLGDVRLGRDVTLLVQASEKFDADYRQNQNFALVAPVRLDSPPPREDVLHMILSGVFIVVAIALASTEKVDLFISVGWCSFLMIATKCLSLKQAGKAVNVPVVITIAASFGVAKAMESSGFAAVIAKAIVNALGHFGPLGVLAAIYITTSMLTEIITNNGAVALMYPIIAAKEVGLIFTQNVNVYAAMYVLMLAGSASFLTPIGYQTNLMVHEAAGYRFYDWFRYGFILQVALGVVGVIASNWFWPSS